MPAPRSENCTKRRAVHQWQRNPQRPAIVHTASFGPIRIDPLGRTIGCLYKWIERTTLVKATSVRSWRPQSLPIIGIIGIREPPFRKRDFGHFSEMRVIQPSAIPVHYTTVLIESR